MFSNISKGKAAIRDLLLTEFSSGRSPMSIVVKERE